MKLVYFAIALLALPDQQGIVGATRLALKNSSEAKLSVEELEPGTPMEYCADAGPLWPRPMNLNDFRNNQRFKALEPTPPPSPLFNEFLAARRGEIYTGPKAIIDVETEPLTSPTGVKK